MNSSNEFCSADDLEAGTALRALLRPCPVGEFLSGYWESTYLHVSREESELPARLMSVADIDWLLTRVYAGNARRWDTVRVARDGYLVPPDEFLRHREGPLAQIDIERVVQMYQQGASVVLNRVHEVLPAVFRFCQDLAEFFGVNVHANAYINPPFSQSLPLHFDSHDVFMLQIAGEKDWRLYPSPVKLATRATQGDNCPEPTGPGGSVSLRTGEVLYLPRGLLHEGVTGDSLSLHLSIGVSQYSWAQLFTDVLTRLEQEDDRFRRSVAARLAAAGADGEEFGEILGSLAACLADASLAHEAATRHAALVRRQNCRPGRGRFLAVADPAEIVVETVVQLRPGCDPVIESRAGDVILRFGGRALALPRFTEPHLRCLLAGAAIAAAGLPPGLDEAGRLLLVRRLVREGLLVVL